MSDLQTAKPQPEGENCYLQNLANTLEVTIKMKGKFFLSSLCSQVDFFHSNLAINPVYNAKMTNSSHCTSVLTTAREPAPASSEQN